MFLLQTEQIHRIIFIQNDNRIILSKNNVDHPNKEDDKGVVKNHRF